MDEHRVEAPPEPDRTHVALEVLALGVQAAADLEHGGGQVDERELEPGLHVRGVVPAARAELEHLGDLAPGVVLDHLSVLGGLLGVVLRRREQRPPLGQVAVQAGEVVHDVRVVVLRQAVVPF